MLPSDMKILANLANQISENSKVVEIGSRIGGSAKIILDHAPKTISMTCIDEEWKPEGEPITKLLKHTSMFHLINLFPKILDHESTYSYTKEVLRDYDNVTLLPASSPYDLQNWNQMVDFVFEDSGHENPQLNDNLRFWWDKLNYGGIMAGHDYTELWPDVVSEANLLATQEGCELHVEGWIWWVVKKSKEI
jgi:hypothetical protein